MSMKINFDVDIDVPNREFLLEHLDYVTARAENNKHGRHLSGIYLQPIPFDPFTGVSTIDHKEAEKLGYFKIDILNNSVYEKVSSNEELDELTKDPMWELLTHQEVVARLPHVNMHGVLLRQYKPSSVEELAIVIALIRPGKKRLQGKSFDEIRPEIWKKPEDDSYYYKKGHAISYAMSIVVALNKMVNDLF